MKKKFLVLILVLTISLSYSVDKAHSLFGIGDLVFDVTAFAQLLLDYIVQLESLAQEVLAAEQLVLQTQMFILNMKNLNFTGLPIVGGLFDAGMRLFDTASGMVYTAAAIKEAFDELWQPFGGEVMAGSDFYKKSFDWGEQTRRAHLDVMTLQHSMPVNLEHIGMVVRETLSRSAVAEGNLQAQQAGNELLGTMTQQLTLVNQQLSMEATAAGTQRMMDAATTDQAQLNAERWMFEFGVVPETTGLSSLPRLR
jgi:P-type conjugative transfer protein TrbJ